MRIIYPFLLPGGLFFAAGALLLSQPAVPQALEPYLPLLFPLLFLVGVLAGWRFNRTRLIFALLVLGLALLLLQFHDLPAQSFELLAVLLPLNLLLILLLPEKGMISNWVALFGSLLLAEALVSVWLLTQSLTPLTLLLEEPLPFSLPLSVQPSIVQACSAGVSLFGALFVVYHRRNPLEAALFWSIMLISLLCYLQPDLQMTRLIFSLGGLTLLAGLFETSHSMAYRDELTGIAGRRAFNEALERLGNRYCLAMLDIDHFKKFNDKHGHDVGDQVLKMVAAKLSTVTGGGRTFRYGGEEFAVLFPGRTLAEDLPQLEALRDKVASATFIPRSAQRPKKKPKKPPRARNTQRGLSVTISIGVAESGRDLRSPELTLQAADRALYKAKEQGRNRVCH